jgi:glutathione S-transferase
MIGGPFIGAVFICATLGSQRKTGPCLSFEFVAGRKHSIADMAIYPWIVPHTFQEQNLDDFPNLKRWFNVIGAREATQRAYALADKINPPKP